MSILDKTTNTTEIKIYIADLAAYNAGILHGIWIDATLDIDEVQDEIDSLLKNSPTPNAEECAIHNYEGFEGIEISEYEGLNSVREKALFIEEHGKLGAAVFEHCSDIDEACEALEENYYGQYESVADYAQNFIEQSYDIPPYLEGYVDYEKMGRDMELSGDIWSVELGYQKIHIFWVN